MSSKNSPGPSQRWEPLRLPPGLAPADLHTQVCQRLSVLDAAERTIAEERSELCTAWNRSLLVNQLPSELLVFIFVYVSDAISASKSHLYLNRCYSNTKWTKVIKVCRHWRDVAYSSPALWRAILMRSTTYTQRALALSTPATVDAFFVNCQTILKNLKLLRPHAQRLRSLSFEGIGMSWKSAVFALFQGDNGMPTLGTLGLPLAQGSVSDSPDDDFADIQLTLERFPYLRSLIVAPQDVQSLTLVSILQRIQGDWVARDVPSKKPLSLRHLQSLSLADHPPIYTSRFLSHVLLSPTVSLRIDGYLGDVAEGDVTETVSALLPPKPTVIVPALALATDVSVNVYDMEYSLVGRVGLRAPASSLVTLDIHSSAISDWRGNSSHHGARDLLSVFSSAPLTTLRFMADCGGVAAETWTEIFDRYPLLETLSLGIVGTTETAFTGLMNAAPTADSPVPCPGLRSISVTGRFDEGSLDATLRCLRDRAKKGHRLGKISMDLWGDQGDDLSFETHYIPPLKELVAEANY
ncbi:hypothetical protein V8D89_007168 [Ganoderma adspersum]